jgi:hypothetical protein
MRQFMAIRFAALIEFTASQVDSASRVDAFGCLHRYREFTATPIYASLFNFM